MIGKTNMTNMMNMTNMTNNTINNTINNAKASAFHRFLQPVIVLTLCAMVLAPLGGLERLGMTTAQAASHSDSHDHESAPADLVGWMTIDGPIIEGPSPFAWVPEEDLGLTMNRLIRQMELVATNDRYTGLVIHLDMAPIGLSQVHQLHRAMAKVRAAEKKVIVFSETYDLGGYLLACGADEIALQKNGQVMIQGIGVEEMYLAGLLEKVGMKADMIQIGEFKGASEQLMRKGPSGAWDENMDGLLDSMYDQVVGIIERGRKLPRWQVEAIFADCWTMTDEDYIKRNVVDKLAGRDLADVTSAAFGDHFEWRDMLASKPTQQIDSPFALFSLLFQQQKPRSTKPSIALVHARGAIYSGESSSGGLFGGETTIGSRTMIQTLRSAASNDTIKGVVLRIDSPGGSALASEMIWQAIRELAKEKPVYVSIGSMAASGGYYLACAGEEIYVEPSSIVGSIGVVGGKITMGGLYEWAGVKVHRRVRGPMGDIFNSVDPFTPEQRLAIKTSMEQIYEQFTDRVMQGRGKRIDDIDQVARGRLFMGVRAAQNGLADHVAGVQTAIADLATDLDLEEGDYDVIDLPRAKTLPEMLEEMFGGAEVRAKAAGLSGLSGLREIQMARQVLGEARWKAIEPILTGLMMLQREPVLTLMPAAVIVR